MVRSGITAARLGRRRTPSDRNPATEFITGEEDARAHCLCAQAFACAGAACC